MLPVEPLDTGCMLVATEVSVKASGTCYAEVAQTMQSSARQENNGHGVAM